MEIMQITLNNRPESIDKIQLSVSELLEIKNYTFKMLVIKINGILVKKDIYNNTFIKDGDDVMVLHLVSGG
ncbi:MAG TPA: thiamine biosynthesis protein ThiS [Bacteroidales bacterium]|nr:thiamine biosynthesis protein ThiS [Bacteroidales bacterium]